ncbi:DUF6882 domain-containing protein [Actinomadura sp. 9N407]|uniref:DUF6882 domain-containing protein n=1 Tax=Actinomadura sp. 9N407 TaxID=3375154 RepID=UPI0037A67AEC
MSRETAYSPAFKAFGAEHSAAAIQRQEALDASLGTEHRTADLQARTLRGNGSTVGGVTSLGSFSHVTQTWLWSWANPNFDWDHVAVAPLRRIHEYGERNGIPELTTGHLEFGGFPDPHQAATTLAIAAGYLLDGNGVWSCTINDGKGSAYVHLDDPQLPSPGFDPLAASRLLMTAVEVFPEDHRRTVRGYFERCAVPYEETADTIAGGAPDGDRIQANFDERGRLEKVTSHLA